MGAGTGSVMNNMFFFAVLHWLSLITQPQPLSRPVALTLAVPEKEWAPALPLWLVLVLMLEMEPELEVEPELELELELEQEWLLESEAVVGAEC